MPLYPSIILADSPQAWYRLNEISGTVAHDNSGHGNNATLTGSFTLSQAGALGDIDTSIGFDGLTGTLTLPPALSRALVAWTAISLEYWINVGGWQHVVITWNGTTTLTYLNGVQVIPAPGGPLEVMADFSQSGSYQTAGIDEVAIYNYALSATQIRTHYWSIVLSTDRATIPGGTNTATLAGGSNQATITGG